jgi:hypothetical protein
MYLVITRGLVTDPILIAPVMIRKFAHDAQSINLAGLMSEKMRASCKL